MTKNISRRTITAGAAWSVPAIAAAVSSPAMAASTTCSAASMAAIDQAFADALATAQAQTTPLFEINFYQGANMLDGGAQTVYVNVKNISGTEQVIDYTNRLAFDINTYSAATAPNANDTRDGRSVAQVTSSWGQFNVNGGAYTGANTIQYPQQPGVRDSSWVQQQGALEQAIKWEFYGGTVVASGGASEPDLAIYFNDGTEWAGGRVHSNPQYITVTPTNNPALALAPTFPSTGADAACQAYYDQKLAEFDAATQGTPASQFVANGPLSGSYQVGVGEAVDSRTTGNFVPGIQTTASTNGIF